VEDIVVDGVVVIPRMSTTRATVTQAQPKRRMGRGGKLDMNIDKVRLADGEKVMLRAVKEGKVAGRPAHDRRDGCHNVGSLACCSPLSAHARQGRQHSQGHRDPRFHQWRREARALEVCTLDCLLTIQN